MTARNYMIAAALESSVALVNISDLKLKPSFQFTNSSKLVNCVEFNHNNKVVISSSQSGQIFLNLSENGKLLSKISTEEDENISCLSISSDSRLLCAGNSSNTVKIFDLKESKLSQKFEGHTGAVNCIHFSPDERYEYIASGSESGEVLIFDRIKQYSKPVSLRAQNSHSKAIKSLQYSRLRKSLLATAGDDGSVRVWDVILEQPTCSFAEHSGSCSSVRFSPKNNQLLCSAGLDKHLYFYDINDAKSVLSINTGRPISSTVFHEDGSTVAVGTHGKLLLYDLRNYQTPKDSIDIGNHLVNHLAITCYNKLGGRNSTGGKRQSSSNSVKTQNTPQSSAQPKLHEEVKRNYSPSPPAPLAQETRNEHTSNIQIISPARDVPTKTSTHQSKSYTEEIAKFSTRLITPPRNSTDSMDVFSPVGSKMKYTLSTDDNAMSDCSHQYKPKPSPTMTEFESKNNHASHSPSTHHTAFLTTDQSSESRIQNLSPYTSQRASNSSPSNQFKNDALVAENNYENINGDTVKQNAVEGRWTKDKADYGSSSPVQSPTITTQMITLSPPVQNHQHSIPSQMDNASIIAQGSTLTSKSEMEQVVTRAVEQSLSTFRSSIHQDIQNLHLDVLRQFHTQQEEIITFVNKVSSQMKPLIDEIERLREENSKLRKQCQL